MKYEQVLDILTYLTEEENYIPWAAALKSFTFLETRIDEANLPMFKKHVLYLIENIYNKLGFEKSADNTQIDVYLRAQILQWACRYGNEDCIEKSKAQYEAFLADTP